MKAIIKSISICAILLITLSIISGSVLNKPYVQNSSVVGTWTSKSDSNWKLVFTSDKCYQYYSGVLDETDSYVISNTSPQCGVIVPVKDYTSYLRLADLDDASNVTCYHINGINNKNLSLTMVGRSGYMVFKRQ